MNINQSAPFNLASDNLNLLGWQPTDFLDKKQVFRNNR